MVADRRENYLLKMALSGRRARGGPPRGLDLHGFNFTPRRILMRPRKPRTRSPFPGAIKNNCVFACRPNCRRFGSRNRNPAFQAFPADEFCFADVRGAMSLISRLYTLVRGSKGSGNNRRPARCASRAGVRLKLFDGFRVYG